MPGRHKGHATTNTPDLLVIGGGSAGLSAARFAVNLGLSVVLAEADRLGGDCTWSGCVPSKALLHVAKAAQTLRSAEALGLGAHHPATDLQAVLAWVRKAQDQVFQAEAPAMLRSEGVQVVQGPARFTSPTTVQVDAVDYHPRRVLIATGAAPFIPPISGLDAVPYLTYESVWGLGALPEHLLVVGAGPIGCELAQAFLRLGSRVTLLDMADRPLPLEEPDASAMLRRQLEAEGAVVALGQGISGVAGQPGDLRVQAGDASYAGDALLLAVGRRPRIAGLGLEAAGIAATKGAIVVNDALQTSLPHVYAAGDCTGGPQFTHYAGWQAVMAVRNAFLPGTTVGKQRWVPRATFTQPEVAHAGLTEAEAHRTLGGDVTVETLPLAQVDRAWTEGGSEGRIRVILDAAGRVVGASVVGPNAGELIHEWAIAIDRRWRLTDLSSTLHVYPTYSFGHWQLAGAARMRQLVSGRFGSLLRWLAHRA